MFVVIFEVEPKPERWADYLDMAKLLRPELERIDGFIDNERFTSERTDGRVLSLSTWHDEQALIRWRTQATHHLKGQTAGRTEIFADYHLRVGEVEEDAAPDQGAPVQAQRSDTTAVGIAPVVTVTEIPASSGGPGSIELAGFHQPGLVDAEWFASLTNEGKRILLASWRDAAAARAFRPEGVAGLRQRRVLVIRDYGMRDRREAPQYFPDVI